MFQPLSTTPLGADTFRCRTPDAAVGIFGGGEKRPYKNTLKTMELLQDSKGRAWFRARYRYSAQAMRFFMEKEAALSFLFDVPRGTRMEAQLFLNGQAYDLSRGKPMERVADGFMEVEGATALFIFAF